MSDWTQLQCDAGRTGRSPETFAPTAGYGLAVRWSTPLWPERLHNGVQPISVGGVVYVATKDGTLHALDEDDGAALWTCTGLGCVNNTLAYTGGLVIVASLSGLRGVSDDGAYGQLDGDGRQRLHHRAVGRRGLRLRRGTIRASCTALTRPMVRLCGRWIWARRSCNRRPMTA